MNMIHAFPLRKRKTFLIVVQSLCRTEEMGSRKVALLHTTPELHSGPAAGEKGKNNSAGVYSGNNDLPYSSAQGTDKSFGGQKSRRFPQSKHRLSPRNPAVKLELKNGENQMSAELKDWSWLRKGLQTLASPETVRSDSGCRAKAASFPQTNLFSEMECWLRDLRQQ